MNIVTRYIADKDCYVTVMNISNERIVISSIGLSFEPHQQQQIRSSILYTINGMYGSLPLILVDN